MISESLSKTDLKRLLALKKTPLGARVSHSGIMKTLFDEFSIGVKKGRELHLDRGDIKKIREICQKQLGFDIFKEVMPESRVETAKLIPNEKLATKSVKADFISVYSTDGSLFINKESFPVPSGGFITIPFESIESVEHDSILLVENFEAFIGVGDSLVDAGGAMIVYRGDNSGKVLSDDFKVKFPDKQLAGWFDYDPAGISLAKSCGCDAVFIPDVDEGTFNLYGRKTLYENQERYIDGIEGFLSEEALLPLRRAQAGFTQEAMIAHKTKLKLWKTMS